MYFMVNVFYIKSEGLWAYFFIQRMSSPFLFTSDYEVYSVLFIHERNVRDVDWNYSRDRRKSQKGKSSICFRKITTLRNFLN